MAQQSSPPDRTESSTTNAGVTRRSYVRSIIAGAAARMSTTAAGVTKIGLTAMGTVAASDHEVIRASGQTIRIGQGESFENTLIDITTDDSIALVVDGGGSAIRNVGFKGLYRGVDFPISISAPDGEVLVENVYLGDGAAEGSDYGSAAVSYHDEAGSDVTFRYCNVQGWPNNGFDWSTTASSGSVTFEKCYAKNNGIAPFRCVGSDDSIRDCVAYNDEPDYGLGDGEFTGTSLGFESGASSRRTRGERRTDDVDDDPDRSITEGVPTSAEEAAAE